MARIGNSTTTLCSIILAAAPGLTSAMDFGGAADKIGRQFLERIREEVRRRAFPVRSDRAPSGRSSSAPASGRPA